MFAFSKELRFLCRLDLSHNLLSRLKSGIFLKLEHLYHLDLSHNLITDITKATFRGLKRLLHLYLNRNRITILYRLMFYRLKQLQVIHLQDNPISEWGNDTFNCGVCSTKIDVNLSGTKILNSLRSTLNAHIFRGSPSPISSFDLSRNNISFRRDSYLFMRAHVKTLYLNNNNISNIPQNTFSRSRFFETTIYLNNNKITSLYAVSFAAVQRKLQRLYLDNNQISFIQLGTFNIYYLVTLSLSYNNISQLLSGIFESNDNLKNLNMSHNKISCLTVGVFTLKENRSSSVINLDLGHNRLIELNSTIFKDLNNVLNLSLSNNNISVVQETTFSEMKYLENLNLKNNEISQIDTLTFRYNGKLNALFLDGNKLATCLWLGDLSKSVEVLKFKGPFVNNDTCSYRMNCSRFRKQSTIEVLKFKKSFL